MNQLAGSASLYLRQHADDPVEWRPWSDEAFAEAAERDVPVLLSVGYSACHWCHVMQRESFRDADTAAMLNGGFVPVKVDREERPDVDAVYMDYVTATIGRGGWPMTVFLTPDRLPLLGGTYFPPVASGRMPAFRDVLSQVAETFAGDRERLDATARAARDFLEDMAAPKTPGEVAPELVQRAANVLLMAADQVSGGLGTGAKFPQFGLLMFLVRFQQMQSRPDGEITFVLRSSLEAALRGGLFDHVGGGVFRYTVDRAWSVPHFEKMLYDNAMLLRALAAAHVLEPGDEFARAAAATAAWLEREMRLANGTYASALSADTDGVEGATYTWTRVELAEALSEGELALAESALGVTEEGDLDGGNVLTRREGPGEDPGPVDALLARLAELRSARPQPDRDEKAIVSWNALAARGLLEAGNAFGDASLVARGTDLLRGLLDATAEGVVHVLDDPAVADVRLAEDHAHLAAAALTAFEVTGEPGMLDAARRLHETTERLFVDGVTVWMTPAETDLPVRPREHADEPVPSGASTYAETALRLARLDADDEAFARVGHLLGSWWAAADYAPQSSGTALSVMAEWLGGRR